MRKEHEEVFDFFLYVIVPVIGLWLFFLFIKAAVKSAFRDIMEEMALKKPQEEEKQKDDKN